VGWVRSGGDRPGGGSTCNHYAPPEGIILQKRFRLIAIGVLTLIDNVVWRHRRLLGQIPYSALTCRHDHTGTPGQIGHACSAVFVDGEARPGR